MRRINALSVVQGAVLGLLFVPTGLAVANSAPAAPARPVLGATGTVEKASTLPNDFGFVPRAYAAGERVEDSGVRTRLVEVKLN